MGFTIWSNLTVVLSVVVFAIAFASYCDAQDRRHRTRKRATGAAERSDLR